VGVYKTLRVYTKRKWYHACKTTRWNKLRNKRSYSL
jgi:hypothetical protein